uniref:Uncharacterized protein n=1 Tax=Candidatus Kentrum sp. DK TaxID=2126562 RepID=A0A450SKC1_9GAMM|nr:MAG: hypothetical protein BECKDK2373C_GA0170839_104120 [Candidatus Kentron sp. DK]
MTIAPPAYAGSCCLMRFDAVRSSPASYPSSRTPNDHCPPTYGALCPNGAKSIQPGATPLDRIGRRFSPVRAEYKDPKHDFRLGGGLPLPVRRRVDKLSASTIIPQSRVRASTARVAIPRFQSPPRGAGEPKRPAGLPTIRIVPYNSPATRNSAGGGTKQTTPDTTKQTKEP